MNNKFNIGEVVCHISLPGVKFQVVRKITPSSWEVKNLNTGELLQEPDDLLLNKIDWRESIINYIIDEK
jgi:hypothetical protein